MLQYTYCVLVFFLFSVVVLKPEQLKSVTGPQAATSVLKHFPPTGGIAVGGQPGCPMRGCQELTADRSAVCLPLFPANHKFES